MALVGRAGSRARVCECSCGSAGMAVGDWCVGVVVARGWCVLGRADESFVTSGYGVLAPIVRAVRGGSG